MDFIKVKERMINPYEYDKLRKLIESYKDMSIGVKNVFASQEFIEFLAENYACFDNEPLEAILKLHNQYPLNTISIDFEYEDKFCVYIEATLTSNGEKYTWSAN